MQALILIIIVLVIAGMIASVFKINAYAEAKYQYKPFSLGNFMAVLPGYALAIGGGMFKDSSDPMNSFVMFLVCAVYLTTQLIRLSKKTDFGVALYSLVVMAIGWLPILIFLFLRMSPGQPKRHH